MSELFEKSIRVLELPRLLTMLERHAVSAEAKARARRLTPSDDYGEVRVSALESDPTVCLVEFSFTVAHGLNRIYLTAHITV